MNIEPLSQNEVDRINDLHRGIKKAAVKILTDAFEIGDLFLKAQKKAKQTRVFGGSIWGEWMEKNFPQVSRSSVYQYMRLATNRDLLERLSSSGQPPSIREAIRLIQH